MLQPGGALFRAGSHQRLPSLLITSRGLSEDAQSRSVLRAKIKAAIGDAASSAAEGDVEVIFRIRAPMIESYNLMDIVLIRFRMSLCRLTGTLNLSQPSVRGRSGVRGHADHPMNPGSAGLRPERRLAPRLHRSAASGLSH